MAKLRDHVLNANAILNFLVDGPGAPKMKLLLADAVRDEKPLLVSVANWGEVFYHLWQQHGEEFARSTLNRLSRLPIELIDVDLAVVMQAAEIKARHKIPYVDCLAGALAIVRNAVLVTSDRDFEKLGHRLEVIWLARA